LGRGKPAEISKLSAGRRIACELLHADRRRAALARSDSPIMEVSDASMVFVSIAASSQREIG
jgi:hypothetical protein